MGDSGSLVGGFIISVLCIQFLELNVGDTNLSSPHICIAIMIIPLFDTLRVFVLRSLQGKSPFTPDKNHIHHKLLSYGLSQTGTVLVLLGVNLLLVTVAVFVGSLIDINVFVIGLLIIALGISYFFVVWDKRINS